MVASHTVAGALSTHYRGKSDEVIEAIKKSGGYVGICAYPAFLQGDLTINSFLDHIDYVAKKFGVDHVAIGTDHGISISSWQPSGSSMPAGRHIWEQYWQNPAKDLTHTGMTPDHSDALTWTNWPLFTVGLVKRGYTDDEIRKIIGGNVLRVCQQTMEE